MRQCLRSSRPAFKGEGCKDFTRHLLRRSDQQKSKGKKRWHHSHFHHTSVSFDDDDDDGIFEPYFNHHPFIVGFIDPKKTVRLSSSNHREGLVVHLHRTHMIGVHVQRTCDLGMFFPPRIPGKAGVEGGLNLGWTWKFDQDLWVQLKI